MWEVDYRCLQNWKIWWKGLCKSKCQKKIKKIVKNIYHADKEHTDVVVTYTDVVTTS